MAPELFTTMEANELVELARKVRAWQLARKPALSDAALCKKYTDLGSTKTFKRILDGDLAELSLETQLTNYRKVWNLLCITLDDDGQAEEINADLYAAACLREAFAETIRETGKGRVIFLLGPPDSGKTKACKGLLEKYGSRCCYIEASEVWGDSPSAFLSELLAALGCAEVPLLAVARLAKAVELLKESRRAVIIDEGHHLGPRCLNTLKSLVNQTPGEFIVAAIDTLWRRLETKAYEEATQLIGGRMGEKIALGKEVLWSDAARLLDARFAWTLLAECRTKDSPGKRFTDQLCAAAMSHGRLAFVVECCRRAERMAGGEPMTRELFTQAMHAEVKSR
jgi:AAA domain